jgi:G:T-mismatch repair DNA endonuclease (very short patch repair protein)
MEAEENRISPYFRQISVEQFDSQKFKYHGFRTTFELDKIEEAADPQEVLRQCFRRCIEKAMAAAAERGDAADHLGLEIDSPELAYPFGMGIRPITENTIDLLYNRFNQVDQSFKFFDEEGAERSRLLSTLITVKVDTVASDRLPAVLGSAPSRPLPPLSINRTSLITTEPLEGNYCLFYAIELTRIYHSKVLDGRRFSELFGRRKHRQKEYVEALIEGAKIPRGLAEYDAAVYVPAVQRYYNERYPHKYRIFVFTRDGSYKPVIKSPAEEYEIALPIYHHNSHFDGIRHITTFFGKKSYCFQCERPYDRGSTHSTKCKGRCVNCLRVGPSFPCQKSVDASPTTWIECGGCEKKFVTKDCYASHLERGVCDISKRCPTCGVVYRVALVKKNGGHKCEADYCRKCGSYHSKESGCFIQKKPVPSIHDARYVIYDIECTQDCVEERGRRHLPNFVVATVLCTGCIASGQWREDNTQQCVICGPYRTLIWSPFSITSSSVMRQGRSFNCVKSPLKGFLEWLLFTTDSKYPSYALAHYASRYDMLLVFREIFSLGGLNLKLTRQGAKLYRIVVEKKTSIVTKTIFIDSYNFMQLPLSKLVETFKLEVEEKKFFPHMFNRSCNYGVTLPHLPPAEDYLPASMRPKQKAEFEKWYAQHCGKPFNLCEKLAEYCVSDVEILTHAFVSFRKIFMDITHFDIFQQASTMASACMLHYICNYMPEETLAIVPELGYEKHDKASSIALKYLKWYSRVNYVAVRHRDSSQGEYRYKNFKLDGYVEPAQRDVVPRGTADQLQLARPLAIEVYGCAWHGCPKCYPDGQMKMPDGVTAGEKLRRCLQRQREIEEEMDIYVKWECEIRAELKINPEMRQFFNESYDTGPIHPRHDCFFGGRTECFKLLYRVQDGYKISYKDFNSLYPYVCFTTRYPIKHPKVLVFDDSKIVHWTKSGDNPYEGLLKVLVVPPQHLRIPVLPMRVDQRLLFALCRTCATMYPSGAYISDYHCTHQPHDRQFVATCTHMELNAALDDGYVVTQVYRVWQYESWSDQLFKPYIRDFYKFKTEASGWPCECRESEGEKLRFLEENSQLFDIDLDPTLLTKRNDGMRTGGKLGCNCLWGRFSLRNKLSRTRIVSDLSQFADIMEDHRVDVNSIDYIDEESLMITTTEKGEFVEEHASSNVVISLWTTSAARLLLLGALKKVMAVKGAEVLYMDTDSVIYKHPKKLPDPLPSGRHMGELTDEVPPGVEIVEFVCAGPKNYAIQYQNTERTYQNTERTYHIMKIRGFTLNWSCCQLLTYKTFKQKVKALRKREEWEDYFPPTPPEVKFEYPNFIKRSRLGGIYSVKLEKKYQPVVQKGIIDQDYNVLPFGYNPSRNFYRQNH